MDIRARITDLLEQYGWSKYKLAQASDLSTTTVRNIFNRDYQPSISTIESICKGFNITLAEFFTVDSDRSDERQKFMVKYNCLNDKQRQVINDMVDIILNK